MFFQAQRAHHSLKYHPGTAWQLRFSHLVGYGARYYSYLMARSVASTIWQKYFASDPYDSSNGLKYRYSFIITNFFLIAQAGGGNLVSFGFRLLSLSIAAP